MPAAPPMGKRFTGPPLPSPRANFHPSRCRRKPRTPACRRSSPPSSPIVLLCSANRTTIPAWQGGHLDYAFALGSPAPAANVLLNAPRLPRRPPRLVFLLAPGRRRQRRCFRQPGASDPVSFNFFPAHVTFRGVHDPRWWTFEDAVTDFGALDAQHVDLAKLLVMEFALVYGGNWFSVPVPTPIGNLSRVVTLVVTDTFGLRTLIRPSEQTMSPPAKRPGLCSSSPEAEPGPTSS